MLLKAGNQMKLLPFADNRSAPKAKGASAKREYAIAIATGPYRNAAAAEQTAAAQRVEVAYKEGMRSSCRFGTCMGLHSLRKTGGLASASARRSTSARASNASRRSNGEGSAALHSLALLRSLARA